MVFVFSKSETTRMRCADTGRKKAPSLLETGPVRLSRCRLQTCYEAKISMVSPSARVTMAFFQVRV